MQIKRYSSGTNGIAKHPQPDVRQFAGCLYFWSQMREIVQIINEGEERITSDESKAKTIISYFNESDAASEKKKTVMTGF